MLLRLLGPQRTGSERSPARAPSHARPHLSPFSHIQGRASDGTPHILEDWLARTRRRPVAARHRSQRICSAVQDRVVCAAVVAVDRRAPPGSQWHSSRLDHALLCGAIMATNLVCPVTVCLQQTIHTFLVAATTAARVPLTVQHPCLPLPLISSYHDHHHHQMLPPGLLLFSPSNLSQCPLHSSDGLLLVLTLTRASLIRRRRLPRPHHLVLCPILRSSTILALHKSSIHSKRSCTQIALTSAPSIADPKRPNLQPADR